MLSFQDTNQSSPSYGCFHYPYWRDKTSEYPDARFQEVGATLGLLTHPLFIQKVPDAYRSQLPRAFSAGLQFWNKQQHTDGSFDEWYKHEHGFAATEFTLIAFGLALHYLGDLIGKDDRELFGVTAHKACRLLQKRDDMVKMNHEMAGAAALAIGAKVLNNDGYMKSAAEKHQMVLDRQTQEGWFNEINGMDLGYCSVLLDYAMLYRQFSSDQSGTEAMVRLFRFLFPAIHKDLTISAETGLCQNSYVSRLGTLLLAPDCEEATTIASTFTKFSPMQEGIGPYLMDDVRLCRWSYLPVTVLLVLGGDEESFDKKAQVKEPSTVYNREANFVTVHDDNWSMSFAPCGGGEVKIVHRHEDQIWSMIDNGYHIFFQSQTYCSVGYDRFRDVKIVGERAWELNLAFAPASFMFPGFISRLGLRVLGMIPGFPNYLRMVIDLYRKVNKTALNQSSAPVANKNAVFTMLRKVKVESNTVVIEDRLFSKVGHVIDPVKVEMNGSFGTETHRLLKKLKGASKSAKLNVVKTIDLSVEPQLDCRIEEEA